MAFLLFSKQITYSIRCSHLQTPISALSPSFTSTSSSYSIPLPTHCVISEFLLNECGLCPPQVTKVMTRTPQLLKTRSDHTTREAIQFLRDSGFTEKQLHKIIVQNPFFLLLKVDGQLKPKMEFIKTLGFTQKHLAIVISKQPRLLTFSLEKSLRPKIASLKNLFGPRVDLCKALITSPALLVSNVEKQIKPKMVYVRNNMGILEGSQIFVRAVNEVIHAGFENVERKMKFMLSIGFLDEEIHQILKKCPYILRLSTKNMQESTDFLIHTAGFTSSTIVSNPGLLNLSIEKRLRPRYEIFKTLSTKPHLKCLPSLLTIFRLSEKNFLNKFSQSKNLSLQLSSPS